MAKVDGLIIKRDNLDATNTGEAVVRKLVAGTNITFSSTGPDAGTGDVTINSTGGGSTEGVHFQTVTTTDATQTTLDTLTLADNEMIMFTAEIACRLDAVTNKSYWAKIEGGVRRNNASSAVLVGTIKKASDSEGTPGYDATVDVSGNDLRVRVTGAAAETVNWSCKLRWQTDSNVEGNIGIDSLNGLTDATQTFATGASGSDFNISSSGSAHTFNIPDASATNRGLLTAGAQTIAGSKTFTSEMFADTITQEVASSQLLLQATATGGWISLRTSTAQPLEFWTNSTNRWIIEGSTGHLNPISTTSYDIGSSSTRVRTVYNATSNTITTFDEVVLDVHSTDTSYTSQMQRLNNYTTATSAYEFLRCSSGNFADNEFRLRGEGTAFADGSWNGGGADYAEYFESTDGTALPVGETVVLVNGKVRVYNSGTDLDTDIIGVVRPKTGASAVVGNHPLKWHNKYLRDAYGAYILDADGYRQLNPSYDDTQTYETREERVEWNVIGLLGQIPISNTATKHPDWKYMWDVDASVKMYFVGK